MPGRQVNDRAARGAAAESLARRTLEASGLRWLASNVRYRFGELDLVMRDGDTLVFVEVRLRGQKSFADGVLSVDAHKRRRLVMAAQAFLGTHARGPLPPCRFDVVALDGDAANVRWIRNAFTLDDA